MTRPTRPPIAHEHKVVTAHSGRKRRAGPSNLVLQPLLGQGGAQRVAHTGVLALADNAHVERQHDALVRRNLREGDRGR